MNEKEKVLTAVKIIIEYCKNHNKCEGCILNGENDKGNYCKINYKPPYWEMEKEND